MSPESAGFLFLCGFWAVMGPIIMLVTVWLTGMLL